MKWYYTIFDLNMSVGQYDRCLMVQWFCFISDRPFDIWKSYFQIIKWCYTVFHLSMTVSHCDLYFMVQWFCPVSERHSTDLFTLLARHNSGELCCNVTALVVNCYTLKKHHCISSLGLQGENLTTQYQPRHLLELLEIIFCQFRCVANIHKIVLQNLQRIIVSSVLVQSNQS